MKTVFVGGSRRLGRLNNVVRTRLDNIVERGLYVVVGDANGSDRAVQAYLAEKGYRDVAVFCMQGVCRNNVGGWPVREVESVGERGFDYYSLKDAEMARNADCGFMIWDGNSKGTLVNVRRMVKAGKPVVVYFSPKRKCRTVRTLADLTDLVSGCAQADRQRLAQLCAEAPEQVTLFPADDGSLANKRLQRTVRSRRR